MDCPRCGTPLTRISLNGELQSVYCERCRFADVESDHTSTSAGEETWDDALRRFRSANADADAGTVSAVDGDSADSSEPDGGPGDPPANDGDSEGDDTADEEAATGDTADEETEADDAVGSELGADTDHGDGTRSDAEEA